MFQRRHFEFIARTIRGGNNYPSETARLAVAIDFADMLQDTNANFNRERFLKACGAEDAEETED